MALLRLGIGYRAAVDESYGGYRCRRRVHPATARVLSRHTGYDANISRTLLEACATAMS